MKKTEKTQKPDKTLTDYFKEYLAHKKKFKTERKKLIIKGNGLGKTNQNIEGDLVDSQTMQEEIEELRKKKLEHYKKRKKELLSGLNEQEGCLMGVPEEEKKLKKKKKKKKKNDKSEKKTLNVESEDFDPDFIRR